VVWANQYRLRTFSYPVGMGIHFTHLSRAAAEVQKLLKAGGS
jgi:hypothetical protein